jgi:hypothetical protein
MQALFRPNTVPPGNDPQVAPRFRHARAAPPAPLSFGNVGCMAANLPRIIRIGGNILASQALLASSVPSKSRIDFSGGENFVDKADAA